MLSIYTNPTSLAAQLNLQIAQRALQKNISKLTSHGNHNNTGDDARGVSISDTLASRTFRPTLSYPKLTNDLVNEVIDSMQTGIVQDPTAALQAQANQSPDRAMVLLR